MPDSSQINVVSFISNHNFWAAACFLLQNGSLCAQGTDLPPTVLMKSVALQALEEIMFAALWISKTALNPWLRQSHFTADSLQPTSDSLYYIPFIPTLRGHWIGWILGVYIYTFNCDTSFIMKEAVQYISRFFNENPFIFQSSVVYHSSIPL